MKTLISILRIALDLAPICGPRAPIAAAEAHVDAYLAHGFFISQYY
jgi:hypothetical protein